MDPIKFDQSHNSSASYLVKAVVMNKLSERIPTRHFTFYPRIKHARTNPRRLTHMNVFNEEHNLKAVEWMKDSFEGLCWQLLVFNIYSSDCSPQCKLDVTDRLHTNEIWATQQENWLNRASQQRWTMTPNILQLKAKKWNIGANGAAFRSWWSYGTMIHKQNKQLKRETAEARQSITKHESLSLVTSQSLPAKNSQQSIKNKQLIYDHANSFPAIWKRSTVAVITQRLMICVCSTPPIIAECLNFRMLHFMWKPWQEIKIMWCFYKDLQMHKW